MPFGALVWSELQLLSLQTFFVHFKDLCKVGTQGDPSGMPNCHPRSLAISESAREVLLMLLDVVRTSWILQHTHGQLYIVTALSNNALQHHVTEGL